MTACGVCCQHRSLSWLLQLLLPSRPASIPACCCFCRWMLCLLPLHVHTYARHMLP
jgi:hypothetical protein